MAKKSFIKIAISCAAAGMAAVAVFASAGCSDPAAVGKAPDAGDALHGLANHGSPHDRPAPYADGLAEDGRWYQSLDGGHLIEVSAFPPDATPTDEQRTAASEFVARARAAMEQFVDKERAVALGYEYWPDIDTYHLVNEAYARDGVTLDVDRPEFVMYDPETEEFLGVMFLTNGWEPGLQLGGPLTVWHFHPAFGATLRCWDGPLPIANDWRGVSGSCQTGSERDRSPEMLHVWWEDPPGGPFASSMPGMSSQGH